MPIKTELIHYGDDIGYFAMPAHAATPLPAVIVIQEIGGVNAQIEETTRRIAAAGYAAFAPDLFAKDGARLPHLTKERLGEMWAFTSTLPPGTLFNPPAREQALATLPEAERNSISETMRGIMRAMTPEGTLTAMAQLRNAFRYLREERPETRGEPVACVGFCMGGGLSSLLACEEPELAGAAIFYGEAPPKEKVPAIKCPIIGFYGEKDERLNSGLPAFEEAMKAAGKSYERHIYKGASHAFFNEDIPVYNVDAVRDSFVRLLSFFQRVLSG